MTMAGLLWMPGISQATPARLPSHDLAKRLYRPEAKSPFQNRRTAEIDRASSKMYGNSVLKSAYEPTYALGPATVVGDISAPNGETWYYTADLKYEYIQHEYYTESILKSYSYSIYDKDAKLVGTVSDDVRYADDEVCAVSCDLTPIVTRNFFNTDDNYEIIVSMAVNTATPGANRYRSLVYSIGGEKEGDNDKPISTIDSFVVDVVEGPMLPDGKDNFILSFVEDYAPTPEESENASYWDYLCMQKIITKTYGAARDASGPRLLTSLEIPLIQLPGDQETTPYIMTFVRDGQIYMMSQKLAEPFYEEITDPLSEYEQRQPNTLVVDFYKMDQDGVTKDYTTDIKVEKNEDDDNILYSYYGVGNMLYRGDIVFGHYDQPEGRAALYVCRFDYTPSSDSMVKAYFVYGADGQLLKTLSTQCDATISLSDIEGFEPQQLFVENDGGYYLLRFVNLYSGEAAVEMSNYVETGDDTEPVAIRVNMDRIPSGDSYKYAMEGSYPIDNSRGETLMQIVWLNADGSFDHLEYANMGENVQYAQAYMQSQALLENAYVTGKRAYMVLIKRGQPGDKIDEDLLIAGAQTDTEADPDNILLLQPGEKGSLRSIIPDFISDVHTLGVYWYKDIDENSGTFTQDIYLLPLASTGIGLNPTDEADPITVAGDELRGCGQIEVWNANGFRVAAGQDRVSTQSLSAGVYIARTASGSLKFVKK